MEVQLEKIRDAAQGLLFISETDHPLEPVVLEDDPGDIARVLRTLAGKPAAPIETQTLEYFFRNHVKEYPGMDADQKENIRRFIFLQEVLKEILPGVTVYLVGAVQVDAFIIGRLPGGKWAGLRTKLVET